MFTGGCWGGLGKVGGGTMVIVGCVRPVSILRSCESSSGVRHYGGLGDGVAVVLWGPVWSWLVGGLVHVNWVGWGLCVRSIRCSVVNVIVLPW